MARSVYNNCQKLKTRYEFDQYYAVCINIIYSNKTLVNSPYLSYGYVSIGLFCGYVVNVRYGKSTRLIPTCNYILSLL